MSIKPTNPQMSSADSAGNISRHRKLGELTGNIRIFALPNENRTYTFRMQYAYDSYNRIQTITYPDGETLSYRYDRGGMLESVRGDKGGDHRIYVENISYNTHGLKESVFYGNGTHTDYGYDLLMRLSHLYSENGLGEAMQDIDYGYDDADNITDILNSAMTLANGLGGNYWSHHDYDNLYRLEHSEGEWDGGQQLNYSLLMQYSPNGRIERKELYAEVMDHSGTVTVTDYVNIYQYNAGQPNTLDYVADELSGREQRFSWDAAGNMTVHDHYAEGCSKQMCWDEENRLISFSDHCRNAGFYQYDANGERTYKLTGGYAAQNIQGHWWSYNLLDNPTLYASPYVVATAQGYTKHYYAENERIASRIGNGGLADIAQTVVNMEDLSGDVWVGEMQPVWDEVELSQYHINRLYESRNHLTDAMMCAGEDPLVEEDLLISLRSHWREISDESDFEPDCYWYHPDHLGSSSWITYTDGSAVQHLHYLPWGEDFVDQRTSSWSALYTFSAKEKDSETGFSYFGSRYYNPDLSIWLSVDPMSEKYPYQSNYVYCSNNPLKVIDPNGEDEWEVNKSGHIRHVDGSEGMPDKLFAVRGFGANKFRKRTDIDGLNVDGEIMKGLTASEKSGKICFYQSDCSYDMEEIFNYLADNTNVEWALATVDNYTGTGLTPERGDYLITDHSRLNCNSAALLSACYSYNGGLIRFKHSHPAYYSLSELIDPSQIRTPSGDPNGTDYNDGDYGHKRLCTKPEASPNCIFILRHRGYERKY